MYYRMALIGSHGTGKSSILEEIVKATNLCSIAEIAREYDMNVIDMGVYELLQKKILVKQIEKETELILSCGNFISDRSTIDNMAYYLLKCKDNDQNDKTRYIEIAIKNALSYSHIFYIPIEFPLKSDGFRFEDEEFQHQVDEKILDIIKQFGIPVYFISGSLDERVSKILEVMKWQH